MQGFVKSFFTIFGKILTKILFDYKLHKIS